MRSAVDIIFAVSGFRYASNLNILISVRGQWQIFKGSVEIPLISRLVTRPLRPVFPNPLFSLKSVRGTTRGHDEAKLWPQFLHRGQTARLIVARAYAACDSIAIARAGSQTTLVDVEIYDFAAVKLISARRYLRGNDRPTFSARDPARDTVYVALSRRDFSGERDRYVGHEGIIGKGNGIVSVSRFAEEGLLKGDWYFRWGQMEELRD